MRLTARDKKVIGNFISGKEDYSKKLTSDGDRLDGNWMGGLGIAKWVGEKIVLTDLGSRAAQTVQRALERMAPRVYLSADDRYPVGDPMHPDTPDYHGDWYSENPSTPSYSKNRDDYPTDRELAIAIAYMDREFVDLDKNPITWDMWAEGLAFGGGKGFSKPEPWMVDAAKQMRSQLTKADWEGIGALAYSLGARQGVYEWIMRGGKEY